jgi:hypothetical protein
MQSDYCFLIEGRRLIAAIDCVLKDILVFMQGQVLK